MTLYSLYGGTVQLEFDSAKHSYVVDGVKVPSVTQIAPPKPALMYWAASEAGKFVRANLKPGVPLDELQIEELAKGASNAHKATSGRAASIGTLAHKACEVFAKTGQVEYPVNSEARASFEQFLDWWRAHKITVHASEAKVYSKEHGYAGTCDLFMNIDGLDVVADIKTSSAIYDDMTLQLSAYAEARNEEHYYPGKTIAYEHGLIVRIPKDGGKPETRTWFPSDLEEAFEAFRGLLMYYSWAGMK